jgi:hypothetical protein
VKDFLRILRLLVFTVIAPVVLVVMLFIFLIPHNFDLWFSAERRQEAVDVWRKLWAWVQGDGPIIESPNHPIS